ncbi:MAG: hypothetical protein K9L70_09630 [Thiohalocapsa sp.]|nr:hypothetical protein [Thiohalocapsa sp.]MCF7989865.1 hypothetical protein [Thiohalocapsa sp.]
MHSLKPDGRWGVIVPEGLLFGPTGHKAPSPEQRETRDKPIEHQAIGGKAACDCFTEDRRPKSFYGSGSSGKEHSDTARHGPGSCKPGV